MITFANDTLNQLAEGSYTITISYDPLGKDFVAAEGNTAPANSEISLVIQKAGSMLPNGMFTSNDFAKVYDGTSVTNPTVNLNGQTVKYEYKVKGAADSTYTTTPPTNAGDYTVRITAEANEYCNENVVYIDFTIAKKVASISAGVLSVLSNTEVAVDVTGLLEGHSVVSIKAEADTYTLKDAVIKDANGNDITANYVFTYGIGSLTVTHNSQLAPKAIIIEKVKVDYEVGDVFSDIKVFAMFEDGYEEEVTGFVTNVAEINMSKVGMKELKVSYTANGAPVSDAIYVVVGRLIAE